MLCAWTATDRRSTVLPWRRHEGAGVEHDRPRAPAADHPLAAELAARGHEVQWIGGPADRDVSALKGVRVTAGGLPEHERYLKLVELRPDLGPLPSRARRRAAFSTAFVELSVPSLLGTLRRSVAVWRPDVVVHEAGELAAPLVAAANDIPSVCHGFGRVVPEDATRAAGDVLAPMWDAAGLEPDLHAGRYRGL